MDSGEAIDIILDGVDESGLAELCQQGLDYIYPDWGRTALGLAIAYDKGQSAAILLAAGANPNFFGDNGVPPLVEAYLCHHAALLTLLLLHGADPNAKAPGGFSLREQLDIDGPLDFLAHFTQGEEKQVPHCK